jgi:hypothetical protein
MSQPSNKIWQKAFPFLEKYSIVLGALCLYAYYLLVSVDLFAQHNVRKSFLDLFFQFDSLLLMWGAIYLVVQLQKYRKARKEEEDRQRQLVKEFEHQRLELATLDDVTDLLNDRINNPLSMISLSTSSIRERISGDHTLAVEIDQIETALKRVQEVMMGLQSYHARKIVKLSKESIKAEDKGLAVSSL